MASELEVGKVNINSADGVLQMGSTADNGSPSLKLCEKTVSGEISNGFSFNVDGAGTNNLHIKRHKVDASGTDAMVIDRDSGTVTISKPQQTTGGTPFSGAALKLLPSSATDTTGVSSLALSTSTADNHGFLISGHRAESAGGQPTLRVSTHFNSDTGAVALTINNDKLATFYGGITVSSGVTTLGSFSEVTIASGAITVTSSVHAVDTESDAASDDLDTINGGSNGSILTLRSVTGAREVTLKDSTGNLKLAGDFTLTSANDSITLIKYSSNWIETSRSNNN